MTSTKPGTVFVTGASSGFGAAVARRFAAEGARVIVTARRADRVRDLARELGPQVLPLTLDVRDRAAVAAAFDGLPPEFAAIDLLVNNAGLALGLNPAQDRRSGRLGPDDRHELQGPGLLHPRDPAGHGGPRRGHVINLGSVAGSYPYPGGNVYGGTKAFVHQFSLDLRSDLHGTGVRVTCVEPGMAETEFSTVRYGGDTAKADAVYAGMQPLTADDVAESIYWAATLPPHVNVNTIELMATAQSFAPSRSPAKASSGGSEPAGQPHYSDLVTRPLLNRRLDGLGNSIFGVMSARAVATASINLGQGFPDVDGPRGIAQAAADAVLAGHGNQYPPPTGIPELRQAVARPPAALLRPRLRPRHARC